jgi:hypothetical protein
MSKFTEAEKANAEFCKSTLTEARIRNKASEMLKLLKEISSYDIYDFHNAHAVKDLLVRIKDLTKEIEA